MNLYYIFDVDGTITPPRKPMEQCFIPVFEEFCSKNNVILVSGSDFEKISKQIPEKIQKLTKIFTCNGAETLNIDCDIKDKKLIERLMIHVQLSTFHPKSGNHIEIRKGMINFSIAGRDSTDEIRKSYVEFDAETKERCFIVNDLSKTFPQYQFRIGGEISIDITKKGIDKSLVAKNLLTKDPNASIIFFGDKTVDGNDYPLAKFIEDNRLGYTIQFNYSGLKNFYDYLS